MQTSSRLENNETNIEKTDNSGKYENNNSCTEAVIKPVNIFTLNRENLIELSKNCRSDHSRVSMIRMWREKVQKSRERKSILTDFDDMKEIIDDIHKDIKKDDVNCTNLISEKRNESQEGLKATYKTEMDIGRIDNANSSSSEMEVISELNKKEYFLQMTEAYVHTDDENGLVFYETKLLANHMMEEKNEGQEKNARSRQNAINTYDHNLNCSHQSRSKNYTVPLDYETDALRTELTNLGKPPGPITKTTKRLYIKKLIKYKRKLKLIKELQEKSHDQEISKYELY